MLVIQIPALRWVLIAPLVIPVLRVLCTCCSLDRPQNSYGMREVRCWSQVGYLQLIICGVFLFSGCVCNVRFLGGYFHLDLAMPCYHLLSVCPLVPVLAVLLQLMIAAGCRQRAFLNLPSSASLLILLLCFCWGVSRVVPVLLFCGCDAKALYYSCFPVVACCEIFFSYGQIICCLHCAAVENKNGLKQLREEKHLPLVLSLI